MKIQRRTFLATGLTGLAWAAIPGIAAASKPRARFVISVSGPVDGSVAKGWGHLTAALQQRGFPTTFVSVINPLSSFTGNQVRAAQIVAALKNVKEPVVILGVLRQREVLAHNDIGCRRHGQGVERVAGRRIRAVVRRGEVVEHQRQDGAAYCSRSVQLARLCAAETDVRQMWPEGRGKPPVQARD